MSLPNSRASYQDCYEAFDKALEDPKGIRIRVASFDVASMLRLRLHYARTLHRDDNRLAYEAGHFMHGASIYDKLRVTLRRGADAHFVYIQQVDLDPAAVEGLSEVVDDTEPARPDRELERQAMAAVVEDLKRRV